MMENNQPLNVWQWLEERHYLYLPLWNGYQSPCGRYFISQDMVYRLPGDIIYFLKTGFVRNIKIFDTGWAQPTPQSLGFRAHKDGTCVKIRVVK